VGGEGEVLFFSHGRRTKKRSGEKGKERGKKKRGTLSKNFPMGRSGKQGGGRGGGGKADKTRKRPKRASAYNFVPWRDDKR